MISSVSKGNYSLEWLHEGSVTATSQKNTMKTNSLHSKEKEIKMKLHKRMYLPWSVTGVSFSKKCILITLTLILFPLINVSSCHSETEMLKIRCIKHNVTVTNFSVKRTITNTRHINALVLLWKHQSGPTPLQQQKQVHPFNSDTKWLKKK